MGAMMSQIIFILVSVQFLRQVVDIWPRRVRYNEAVLEGIS